MIEVLQQKLSDYTDELNQLESEILWRSSDSYRLAFKNNCLHVFYQYPSYHETFEEWFEIQKYDKETELKRMLLKQESLTEIVDCIESEIEQRSGRVH